jgi:hypothetical protein
MRSFRFAGHAHTTTCPTIGRVAAAVMAKVNDTVEPLGEDKVRGLRNDVNKLNEDFFNFLYFEPIP